MFGMMHQRLLSLGRGETRSGQIAMREPNWPKRVSQLAHAFFNEFEPPVLCDMHYDSGCQSQCG